MNERIERLEGAIRVGILALESDPDQANDPNGPLAKMRRVLFDPDRRAEPQAEGREPDGWVSQENVDEMKAQRRRSNWMPTLSVARSNNGGAYPVPIYIGTPREEGCNCNGPCGCFHQGSETP